MPTPLQQLEEKVIAAARRVTDRLRPGFEARTCQHIDPDDPEREAKVLAALEQSQLAYALQPHYYLQRLYRYLPYFGGLDSVFEIGVGAGYMLALLRDLLGARVHGVDVKFAQLPVLVELRRELGLHDLVAERPVVAGAPIPIPEGTECVAAFHTVFNKYWDVAEHEWFLQECGRQLVGRRLVICYFNGGGFDDRPEVKALYDRRGDTPLPHEQRFRVVSV